MPPVRRAAHVSRAKLSVHQVREIRSRYRRKNGRLLAEEYGVTSQTILNIVHRKTWAWVQSRSDGEI